MNVIGLDVSMNDALFVGMFQAFEDLSRIFNGFVHGKKTLRIDFISQGVAIEVFHGHEEPVPFLTEFVDGHDVGVVEGASGLSFALEAIDTIFSLLRRRSAGHCQFFDGHPAIHQRVIRFVNNIVRTRNFPDDLVFAKGGWGTIAHYSAGTVSILCDASR